MSGRGYARLFTGLTLVAAIACGCVATADGQAQSELVDELFSEAALAARKESALATPFGRRLLQAIEEPGTSGPLYVFVRCLNAEGEREQIEFFDSGVMIWNNESQVALPAQARAGILSTLLLFGFAELGQSDQPPPSVDPESHESSAAAPLRALCEIEATIGDLDKRVELTNRGGPSPALEELAAQLLRMGRVRSRLGVTAENLGDGLAKIAARDLAPEILRLIFNQRPELSQPDEPGVLLSLRGRSLVARRHSRASGYTPPVEIELTDDQIGDLARELAVRDVGTMPINLWSTDYIDLTVELLNHRKSIQARQFAGIDASTHGDAQYEFNKVVAAVRGLWSQETATRVAPDAPLTDAAGKP